MPKVQVYSAFKDSDKLSQELRQLKNNVKGLTKDINGYRKVANKAFDKRKEIKFDITKAEYQLKKLEKAYLNGDKTAEKSFKNKQKHLDVLKEEYRRLGTVITDASKAEKKLADDLNTNNKSSKSLKGTMKSIAKSDLADMAIDSVSGFATQAISSAYGGSAGEAVGGVIGGAASGAVMGTTVLGPGFGTAIGAAIGGLTGAINTMTKQLEKKDDIFREDVKNIFSTVQEKAKQEFDNGYSIFLKRDEEIKKISSLLGSASNGTNFYNKINDFGIKSPYETQDLLEISKSMLFNNISEDKILEGFNLIGDIAAGNSAKFSEMSEAFTQVEANGKLSGEYLKQLSNRNFDILSILAEKNDSNVEAMRQQMNAGLISSEDVIDAFKIATSEGGSYHNSMNDIMSNYSSKVDKLNDLKAEISSGQGEGFANVRTKGLDKEIAYLGSDFGDEIRQLQGYVGNHKALLENKESEIYIHTFEELFNDGKYKEYKEAAGFLGAYDTKEGAAEAKAAGYSEKDIETAIQKLNDLYFETEQKAKLKWQTSPENIESIKSQNNLIQSLQGLMRDNEEYEEYVDLIKEQNELLSKGMNGFIEIDLDTFRDVERDRLTEEYTEALRVEKLTGSVCLSPNNGLATGLRRVPFDNMPALLHEGERVLTRLEADNLDRIKNSPPTNITLQVSANTSNPYQLAQILYSELKNAMENYGGV